MDIAVIGPPYNRQAINEKLRLIAERGEIIICYFQEGFPLEDFIALVGKLFGYTCYEVTARAGVAGLREFHDSHHYLQVIVRPDFRDKGPWPLVELPSTSNHQ